MSAKVFDFGFDPRPVDAYALAARLGAGIKPGPLPPPAAEGPESESCPLCGRAMTTDAPGLIVLGQVFLPASSDAEARKLEGFCRRGECATERTIGRDAAGNVHNCVAPATMIAFVGAPRRPRFAR